MTFRQAVYLARPHTLPASIAPIVVALILAGFHTHLNILTAILTLAVGVGAQVVSNVANDLFDFKKGADGKKRQGFERPISSGKLSYSEVKAFLFVTVGFTSLTGLVLVALTSPWLLLVGLAVIAGAIAYTGGPYPLAYHGLGEVMVFLFYGLIAGCITYFIQCQTLTWEAVALDSSMGLASCNILIVNNYRDVEEDTASGKRTIFVRFGKQLAPKLYMSNLLLSILLLFPFYSIIGMLSSGIYLAQMMYVQRVMARTEGEQLNNVLVQTARGVVFLALNVAFVLIIHYAISPHWGELHHHH